MGAWKHGILIVALFAVAVAMISCPPPIDENLLIFVEDEIPPNISVFTPDNNSSYRSLLSVAGQVTDSSESEGDNKGSVASLTYQVLDHSQLSGDVPPAGNGFFEFSFATTGLSGTEILVIKAEDWNGNLSEKSLTLHENDEGPFVRIDSPANYTEYRSVVTVQATVQNSETDTSTTEVGSVEWAVPLSTLGDVIDPAEWQDGTFEFTFPTTIPPNELVGPRFVIVTAEDLNAHTSDASVQLLEYPAGPYLELAQPVDGSTYGSVINITGRLADSAAELGLVNEIESLEYKVGTDFPVTIPRSVWENSIPTGTFTASFPRGTFSGTMVIRVTVTDKNAHPTNESRTLLDPATGPQLTATTTPTPAAGFSRTIVVYGTVLNSDGSFPPTDVSSLSAVISPSGASYNFTPGEILAANFSRTFNTDGMFGEQTITVTAVDTSGTRKTETQITIPTDGIGPSVSIGSHAHLDYYPITSDVTVTGTIGHPIEETTWINPSSVKYMISPLILTYQPVDNYSAGAYDFTFNTTGLSGNLTVTVKAEDKNGDPGTFSITLREDTSRPEVIALNPTSGTYGIGETIDVEVVFSEDVEVVSGTPQLTLELDGGATRDVDYSVGLSSGNKLVFPYKVAEDDVASNLNYESPTTSLTGSIKDLQGNTALLTLPGWINTIVFDGVEPGVDYVTASNGSDRYGIGETIDVEVNFSEPVDVTGTPQLSLKVTLGTTRAVNYSSALSTSTKLVFPYTVTEGDGINPLDYDGTGALSGTITDDPAGNPWTGSLPASTSGDTLAERRSIEVDGVRPEIISAEASNKSGGTSGVLESGDKVTITFSEDTNEFDINSGNIDAVLELDNGHSWLDGDDAIGNAGVAEWSSPSVLVITLSEGGTPPELPDVATGDSITVDGTKITDGKNGCDTNAFSSITGSF